jgi:ABC-type transport system substrate-binding protein
MTGIFYENVKKDPGLRLLEPLSSARWSLYITSQWDPKSPWSDVRVRQAASMAIDNVFWGGRVADPRERGKDTMASRALNEKIRDDKRVNLSMIPIGDGLALARKRP